MSVTATCFDGHHDRCGGKVSKWYAEHGDTVIETGILASDGVGVYVACRCNCHQTVSAIEAERLGPVKEYQR